MSFCTKLLFIQCALSLHIVAHTIPRFQYLFEEKIYESNTIPTMIITITFRKNRMFAVSFSWFILIYIDTTLFALLFQLHPVFYITFHLTVRNLWVELRFNNILNHFLICTISFDVWEKMNMNYYILCFIFKTEASIDPMWTPVKNQK